MINILLTILIVYLGIGILIASIWLICSYISSNFEKHFNDNLDKRNCIKVEFLFYCIVFWPILIMGIISGIIIAFKD